ncbi:MAG: DUF4012 domain-containing protein [Candidatus Kerfeldbacteria bacterium]|nr:DUF4012 domain-containing protein [Candidatus Kerfeldbacteria bacterium]
MSSSPNVHPPVPDHNVLDLRQIVAERQVEAAENRRRLPRPDLGRHFRRRPAAAWHMPAAARDWGSIRRQSFFFLVVGLVVIIPAVAIVGVARFAQAAGQVATRGQQAASELQAGLMAWREYQVATARQHFAEAERLFGRIEPDLQGPLGLPPSMVEFLPGLGNRYRTARSLAQAGQSLAQAGQRATTALASAPRPHSNAPRDVIQGWEGSLGFLTPIFSAPATLTAVVNDLAVAERALRSVDPDVLPADYARMVRWWQLVEQSFFPDGRAVEQVGRLLTGLFAQHQAQEYLVVFQNDDELRPSGGFAGTFVLVKFDRGRMRIVDAPATGPFDLTATTPHTTRPPEPLLAVAPYWAFHDANWFLDWPTSASFMLDFYEQARGFRPDGVIALSPAVVEDLLRLTGPLRPPGYDVAVTADNFVRATEQQVELKFDRALNNPKQFILDLIPVLLQSVGSLPTAEALEAVVTILSHAAQANIMLASEDPDFGQTVAELGWNGAVIQTDGDYLSVVDSNLGGGKTDRVVTENVDIAVTLDSGLLRHTVKVTRVHGGQADDPLGFQPNHDFLRIYVPASAQLGSITGASTPPAGFFQTASPGTTPSSKLQRAEGQVLVDSTNHFRFSAENGKRVFGAWSLLPPGQQQTITFTYTVPFDQITDHGLWNMIWQKQPGTVERRWTLSFDPGSRKVREFAPLASSQRDGRQAVWVTTSERSRQFQVVLK